MTGAEPPAGDAEPRGARTKGKPPENWFSLFGFVIVTKADLLAASAFLLSLATLVFQLSDKVSGPKPTIYPPDIVYIFFDDYANNKTIVRFAGQLSFVNSAPLGHDTIVRDVRLRIAAGAGDRTQHWLSFAAVSRKGNQLSVAPKEMAQLFPLSAGNATSRLISFAPRERFCAGAGGNRPCDADADFVNETQFLASIAKSRSLKLTFVARYVGRRDPQEVSCSVPVGEATLQYLAENGWFATRCIPEEGDAES